MKFTKNLFLAALACIPLAFTACGGSSDASSKKTDSQKQTAGQAETQEKETSKASSSGDLGNYSFSINNYTLASDYEGNPAIIVDFDFTNNDDEATSFIVTALPKAFQDGVELSMAIIMDTDVYNAENSLKDIKPGATLNVQHAWVLSSESSPVEVELAEVISFSDEKLVKTFEIAG